MKKQIHGILIVLIWALSISSVYAQSYTYKGKVVDAKTGEPLIGVNITVKDNVHGTVTGYDGTFKYTCQFAPPLEFHVSYVGYEKQNFIVNNDKDFIDIKLKELTILGQEVVVSASRIEEGILGAPVSVEKMNLRDIQQVSAANFYDGLYELKGVDMNVHGLTFRTPNTRGFNSYTNYRMNQVVDGVENIGPGLSFAAGNIFGLSQVDIESVEMVVGASTALYGPGGMNGTLLMRSKDPFRYQGLTVSMQSGLMHLNSNVLDAPRPMGDFNFRFAKAFNNRMAIKLTGSYLSATDWFAADTRDRNYLDDPTKNRLTNPGYDGVNVYGDETLVSLNLKDVAPSIIAGIAENQGIQPGTPEYDALEAKVLPFFPDQIVTRTGWLEKDLTPDAENHAENIRLGASFHYFITEKAELVVQGNYSKGSSVYTAVNRFALKDFSITSGKIEINHPDYFFRIWGNGENSGPSYDLGATALRMNEAWKGSRQWFTDYLAKYTTDALLGSLDPDATPEEVMRRAHISARMTADNRDPVTGNVLNPYQPAIPIPGSPRFAQYRDSISLLSIEDGGSGITETSKMMQAEGMYNFSHIINFVDLQIGANYRLYSINSDGTIYIDEPGNPISIYQFGGFVQAIKSFAKEHLKATGTFRYDKNENFKSQYTPRFSLIYFVDNEKRHSIRGTYQTAYRFPSIPDQLLDMDAGLFRSLGGLKIAHDKYNFSNTYLFPMSGRNPVKDKPVLDNGPLNLPEFGVEKVSSVELGYKGLLFKRKLFIDSYIFYNEYKGFEASQLIAQYDVPNPDENDPYKLYQTYITTDIPVTSMGWAIGLDYLMPNGIMLKGNVAYNKLIDGIDEPGVEAQFNTPDYRANLSIGHHRIIKNLGFNVNIHWQNSFLWQGVFGVGEIPATTTIDAHVAYKIPAIKTVVKLGGSNITNNYYTTSFGSAQVGGLYYITLVYDDVLGYIERRRN
ncbi:MAG: TonB-dependent receptor plug domain-containing protein [Chlorobi bacterium]|nr:TonB-dependent receptor plug domain-containing protein [Chlorobiota bacterium]